MRRPTAAALAIFASAVLVTVSVVTSAEEAKKGPPEGAPAGYQMVAPLDAVMQVMGEAYKRMPELMKANTPKELKEARRDAFFVAEVANLAGQLKEHAGQKEWRTFADNLKTSALSMADAAGKKDAGRFETIYASTNGTCKSCHDKYRDD